MSKTLASVANFAKTISYYVLYGSYKTGHLLRLLVNSVTTTTVDNLVTCFIALYGSIAIFLQDILQCLQKVLSFVASSFKVISTKIDALVYKIMALVYSIALTVPTSTTITSGTNPAIGGLAHIIVFLKKLVVLFGPGEWFLITSVPLLLYYTFILFVSLINKCYQGILDIFSSGVSSIKTFAMGIILFILDIPLEYIAGLSIAFSLAYIFCHFYVLITTYIKQKLQLISTWYRQQQANVMNMMYQRTTRQQPAIQNQTPRTHIPVRARQNVSPTKSIADNSVAYEEKLCVICQERNRCVLLLPCRHFLCLCTKCTKALIRNYNETCPMCRTNIESSMKIYL